MSNNPKCVVVAVVAIVVVLAVIVVIIRFEFSQLQRLYILSILMVCGKTTVMNVKQTLHILLNFFCHLIFLFCVCHAIKLLF